ncbi:hypothetical protein [Nakamurella sp.]|uniref:hypothetical protein n=1 Tax=Nakamurella sp. TaxID=1869182 RepID=UPI003783EFB8
MGRWVLVAVAPAELVLIALLAAGVEVPAGVRATLGLLMIAVLLVEAGRWSRGYRRGRRRGLGRRAAATVAAAELVPPPVTTALRWEARVWTGLVRGLGRRPDIPPGAAAFTHHRAMRAVRWTFVGVLVVEVAAVHLLVPAGALRVTLLLVGLYSLVWVVGYVLGAGPVRPHLVTADRVVLRCGLTTRIEVPLAALADARPVRRSRDRTASRQLAGRTLHLVDNGGTSLDLDLRSAVTVPLPRGRSAEVDALRVWVDDAQAMARQVRAAAGIGPGAPAELPPGR